MGNKTLQSADTSHVVYTGYGWLIKLSNGTASVLPGTMHFCYSSRKCVLIACKAQQSKTEVQFPVFHLVSNPLTFMFILCFVQTK